MFIVRLNAWEADGTGKQLHSSLRLSGLSVLALCVVTDVRLKIFIQVRTAILVEKLLRIRHAMCGSPAGSDLCLWGDVAIVVRSKTTVAAVRWNSLMLSVKPGVLLVVRKKLPG